jgi:hypothetical protein
MPFRLVLGVVQKLEAGEDTLVGLDKYGFASFEEAVGALENTKAFPVHGRAIEANAYVVEADTMHDAAQLVRAVLETHEQSPRVRLVKRGIRTEQVPVEPPEEEPPEIESLDRLHGELCITHQLTEFALSRAQDAPQRERLEQHKQAIENLGYARRVLRAEMAGEEIPADTPGQSGSDRLGYRNGQIQGAESATFAEALSSLTTELSIARHQASLAKGAMPHPESNLDDLDDELYRFETAVMEMGSQQ